MPEDTKNQEITHEERAALLEVERDDLRKDLQAVTKENVEYGRLLDKMSNRTAYYQQQLAIVAPYLGSYCKRLEDENMALNAKLQSIKDQPH